MDALQEISWALSPIIQNNGDLNLNVDNLNKCFQNFKQVLSTTAPTRYNNTAQFLANRTGRSPIFQENQDLANLSVNIQTVYSNLPCVSPMKSAKIY